VVNYTPVTTPPVTGYQAQYYANKTLSGTPVLTRTETDINYSWGSGSPDPSVPVDNFSARWTKTANFTAGDYTFTATADDGLRLYLDGTLVIDKWIDQGTTTYTATRTLAAGNHTIVYEYYDSGWDAVAKLSYQQAVAAPSFSVGSFTLVNTYTDQPIAAYDPLVNGTTLNLATLPTRNVTIRANTTGTIGSVGFNYDGNTSYHMENSAPYSIGGDTNGDYSSWTPTVGQHTLTVTPYSGSDGGGTAGGALTLTFTVVDSPPSSGTELLTSAWNLTGNNGASELYQSIASNALAGKTTVRVTYNLHGLTALGGDASALIFDQNSWKYVSLSNYGQNGLNGSQTVDIPISAFGLDLSQPVGTMHTRFWYGSAFTVDITSVQVL